MRTARLNWLRSAAFASLILLAPSISGAQEGDVQGPFVSLHVGEFWASSRDFTDLYGSKPSTVFEGCFGYRVSKHINTFARLTYHPSSKRTVSYIGEGLDPFRYSVQTRLAKNHVWIVSLGFEFLFLSTDQFSLGAGLGGLIGMATEEKRGYYVSGDPETENFGVAGLTTGLTVEKTIPGTPLSVVLGGQYRYSPPLSSIFTTDYGGVTVDLGIRFSF